MEDFKWLTSEQLWEQIAHNAQQAQWTTNWVELLDNIKVLCVLIDERIDVFQRSQRREQLLKRQRTRTLRRGKERQKRRGYECDMTKH